MWRELQRAFKVTSLSLVLSFCVGFSAYGDDIEIYYGISDQDRAINPNVIFIFDTSGSMGETDGEPTSRMFRSKEALKLAINNISDVNVSLMRFSSKGGPVLMAAEDINAITDEQVIVRTLVGNFDFAVSDSNGDIVTEFSFEGLTDDGYDRVHALRFTNLDIPKNAIIESAHITYFSAGYINDGVNITYTYSGSTANDPQPFTPGANFNELFYEGYNDNNALEITASSCSETGAVCWTPSYWPSFSRPVNSTDLSEVVQAVIQQDNWQSGDPILIFGAASNDTPERNFGALSHAAENNFDQRVKSPQLRVRYSLPLLATSNYKVKNKFESLLEEFVAEGGTPIVDTLYEAYLYINGKAVNAGARRGNTNNIVSSYTRTSAQETFSGSSISNPSNCDPEKLTSLECRFRAVSSPSSAEYISPVDPIIGQCQANYIVLFSDGQPNNTTESSAISNVTGTSCSGESCANVLASYMAKKPSERGADNDDAQVFTYTVGFDSSGFNDSYLRSLANSGEGQYYSGNTTAELANAFTSILIEAKKGASTFVAPGISVNQFNRLTHANDIYYALFDPRSTEYWPGNLKKYKLIDSVVLDNASQPAISTDGFFKDTAHDWWALSSSLDGPFVARGGAAAQQTVPRKVYSNMANVTTAMVSNDARLTKEKLGISAQSNADALRLSIIEWLRGYDETDIDGDSITNEPRYQMADPLHSEPLFFQYGEQASVFLGTNEGYLLSIDAETGQENWAFIPEDLLPNLHNYYENGNVFNQRTYGMDGAINAWTQDGRSYVIVGQRRGGRNYYVLDVTDRLQPIFKYMIEGGQGDFTNLGQSWSKPTITRLKVNGDEKRVLIFGGGYDTNQDDNALREQDSVGTSVFIVEADNGNVIAEIKNSGEHSVTGMNYSIPARIAVIDSNFDGLVDHLYFGDMGGNLFRVDVYNDNPLSSKFKGQKIYTTSQDLVASKNRRFYYAPDVAEIVYQQQHYYAVTIGSGYRAHPLNEDIDDSVLMLKDSGVFAKDDDGFYTFPTISNIAQLDAATPAVSDITAYDGYELNLARGEKVITGVSIINSKLVFSTYDPSSAGLIENTCSAAQGGGRVYVVDLLDGGALYDTDGDGDIDYDDAYVTLDKAGIPAEPRLIITDPESPTLCIGTECADTISSDDDDGAFAKLIGQISGARSRLNKVFTNSWSTEIEPTTKDDN